MHGSLGLFNVNSLSLFTSSQCLLCLKTAWHLVLCIMITRNSSEWSLSHVDYDVELWWNMIMNSLYSSLAVLKSFDLEYGGKLSHSFPILEYNYISNLYTDSDCRKAFGCSVSLVGSLSIYICYWRNNIGYCQLFVLWPLNGTVLWFCVYKYAFFIHVLCQCSGAVAFNLY